MHLIVRYGKLRWLSEWDIEVRTVRSLTERQRSLLERIDCRVPITIIAQELGMSESQISQQIGALKDIYATDSLNELVELYRSEQSVEQLQKPADMGEAFYIQPASLKGFAAHQSPTTGWVPPMNINVCRTRYLTDESSIYEPSAIIGSFDGANAVRTRIGIIAAVFSLFLSSAILSLTAAQFVFSALK